MSAEDTNATPWWAKNSSFFVYPKDKVRTYDTGTVVMSLAVVLLVFGVVAWTIFGTDPARPRKGQFQSVEYPASVEAVLNQCGNIFTFNPSPDHFGVFDTPEVRRELDPDKSMEVPFHPMLVPTYGYMSGDGNIFDKKTYSYHEAPKRSELLRAMWDGTTVIWHSPSLDAQERANLAVYLSEQDDVVAVEWSGGELPMNRRYAFSTWNVSQSCQNWDEVSFEQFRQFVEDHPQYRPKTQEPPAAKVLPDGTLNPIDPPRW